MERNLRRIHGADYGGAALRRDVAATFDSYGRYFYELFRLSTLTPEWINEHFHIAGIEHVVGRRQRREGRGARAAAPRQLGLRRRVARTPGLHGVVVAEPVEPPELFDWFVEARRDWGCA